MLFLNSDEEIPSNTDEEMEAPQENEACKSQMKGVKRKLRCEEYSEILAKRHKSLIPYRYFFHSLFNLY